jgi:ribosomal protein L23
VKDPRDIILRPIISEKSYSLMDKGTYTFEVRPDASKPEIRDAIESIWNVKVTRVNNDQAPSGPLSLFRREMKSRCLRTRASD